MASVKSLSNRDYYQSNEQGKYVTYWPKIKRFNVEPSRQGAFWEDYRELFTGSEPIYLGEVPVATAPMVTRLNLKFVRLDIPGQPEHEPTIPDSEAEAEESEESEEPRLGEEAANSLSANNFSANNLESEDVEEHEEIEPSSTQNAEALLYCICRASLRAKAVGVIIRSSLRHRFMSQQIQRLHSSVLHSGNP